MEDEDEDEMYEPSLDDIDVETLIEEDDLERRPPQLLV